MKKSRLLTWVIVLLYMVSALGMAAWADESGWEFEEDAPAADGAGESAPAAETQPPPPADTGSSGSGENTSGSGGGSADTGAGSSDNKADASNPGDDPSDPGEDPAGPGKDPADPAEDPSDPGPEFFDPDTEFFDPEEEEPFNPDEDPGPDETLPAGCRVWFIHPNGRILLEYEAEAGTPVAEPDFTPRAKKGFVFAYWYEVGGDVTSFAFGAPLEGDLVLAAYFKAVEEDEDEDADEPDGDEPDEEAEEEEEELPPLEVEITSNAGGTTVTPGDMITLYAHVSEWVEGHDCSSIWRRNDGSGWVVIAVDTQTYTFAVNEENYYWKWE
ncbi:MAG: hypothetical protein FWF86_02855, partial [Clostridia bacterium]|nr:hypothetical protein [Clostridia bacterium]